MKKILLFTLLFTSSQLYAHDIQIATFEISDAADGFAIEIALDKEDFGKSLLTAFPDLKVDSGIEVWEAHIKQYIAMNFQLRFNGHCEDLVIDNITYDENYIRLSGHIPSQIRKVSKIDVFNTCLIDYNEGHLNLVRSNINGKNRTFRLSENRISTVIEYVEK